MLNDLMSKIKVLVVDDSAFMRKIVSDMLSFEADIEVIDTARNGQDAVEKVARLSPDVITMDIEMPVMDGLTALEKIMDIKPIPIIMLSSLTKEGTEATVRALEIGALDFIPKPSNIYRFDVKDLREELIQKVRAVSRVKDCKKIIYQVNSFKEYKTKENTISEVSKTVLSPREVNRVVAIATSTGGPRALQEVLPRIPKGVGLSIFVVQHMPAGFTKSLAERLNSLSQITVKEAEDNEVVMPDYAYIAPGDYHMVIERTRDSKLIIRLDKSQPIMGHRPSANVTFESISKLGLKECTAVIMTGMGSDGLEGMKKIKLSTACRIIAQNEESCVVYGMPKAAVNSGIVDRIVDLRSIYCEIMKSVGV